MGRLLPAALAVGLVLLAGCSGDDDPEPKISPTDSSSVASTPTPSPTPSGPVEPTMPAEAEGEDAAAAEAFVRFYWEMVNYAQATGDVATLRSLGQESCAACSGGWQGIAETYDAGGSIRGGAFEVKRVQVQQVSYQGDGKAYSPTVSLLADPQTIHEPGKQTERKAGGSYKLQMIVVSTDGNWLVSRWDTVE